MATSSQEKMKSTVGESKLVVQPSTYEDGLRQHMIITKEGKRKMGLMKPVHMQESAHIVDYYYLQPERTPASTVFTATSTQVDFRLKAGSAAKVRDPALRVTVQNTDGSNTVTMTKLTDSIQMIQYYVNGGVDLIQTQTAAELYQNTQWMTQERFSTIAPQMNTTSSWGAGTAIATSATKAYYLPILGSFFDYAEPFLQAINMDIVIRITFRNSVSAGTGVLALANNGLELLMTQDHGTNDDQKHIMDLHKQFVWRNLYFNVMNLTAQATFTASTATNISLRAATGKAVFMTFCLRATNVPATDGYSTFTALENTTGSTSSVALLDSQNRSILGGGTITPVKLRYIDYPRHANSQFSQNNANYLIPFSDSALRSFTDATLSRGYYYMSGDECTLQITPSSTFSTGSYYYDILIYFLNYCDLENGRFAFGTI